MLVRDRNIQQLDHESDDFSRREVLPGLLAALFRKAPEQLFVYVAHLQPGELVGTEREFLVLVEDRRQAVVFHHQADGGAIVEMLDDVVNVLRETVDVGAEILLQQGVIFFVDRPERPVCFVGERALLRIQLQFLDQLGEFFLGGLWPVLEHLGGLFRPPIDQHTFQAADHDDGQDDALVFVGLELSAQALGGLPDVGGEVVELRFVEG